MTVGQFILGHLWQVVLLPVLLLVSAFFAAAETALFSLTRAELVKFQRGRNHLEHLAARLMRNPRRLLMALLLSHQLIRVAFFAVSAAMLLDLPRLGIGWAAMTALSLVPLLVVILFSEVTPKVLAVFSPSRVAPLAAVPLAALDRVLGPMQAVLVWGLIDPLTRLVHPSRRVHRSLTSDELHQALELSLERRLVTPREADWLQEVIGLSQVRVSAIMVPRVDIVAYDADQPTSGLVELFRRTQRKKVPIYRGSLDNIVGLVHVKQSLLNPKAPLRTLIRPVLFVPEQATVDKLLLQFRREKTQLAVAVDEFGGTAGLVTLEDALEEIVGQIASPGESTEEPVRHLPGGEYLIQGDLGVHDWLDLFPVDLPSPRVSTVGGLAMALLGRVPKVGDTVRYGDLELVVEAMRGRRVSLVRLRLAGEGRP